MYLWWEKNITYRKLILSSFSPSFFHKFKALFDF
jgi:hypothetical protein